MVPLIGLVAFIMILAGGFKILTSGRRQGNGWWQTDYHSRRSRHPLAIISWLILLLIENTTGAAVTQFKFGFN